MTDTENSIQKLDDVPFLLSKPRVNTDGGEIARNEELVQFNSTGYGFDKYYDLHSADEANKNLLRWKHIPD